MNDVVTAAVDASYRDQLADAFRVFVDGRLSGAPDALAKFHTAVAFLTECRELVLAPNGANP